MSEKVADTQVETACARYAHESNRIYCLALGIEVPTWEAIDQGQKDGLHNMVEFVLAGGTAESAHVVWVQHMRKLGYQHGARVDPAERTHPKMIAWDAMPMGQRLKEELSVASINLMALVLGHSRRPMATETRTVTIDRGDTMPPSAKEVMP